MYFDPQNLHTHIFVPRWDPQIEESIKVRAVPDRPELGSEFAPVRLHDCGLSADEK